MKTGSAASVFIIITLAVFSTVFAQEKKVDKFRVGGGSASAAQMSLWFAKEGNY